MASHAVGCPFHMEGGTLMICTNSKNVSYLDCLWGELYGSINNGFLRIFAK